MKTIHKFPINGDMIEVAASDPQRVVHFGKRGERFCLWIELKPRLPYASGAMKKRATFKVYGTRHEIADDAVWVATSMDGDFVWHLYQLTEWK